MELFIKQPYLHKAIGKIVDEMNGSTGIIAKMNGSTGIIAKACLPIVGVDSKAHRFYW